MSSDCTFARQTERTAVCDYTAAAGESSPARDAEQGTIAGECGHPTAPVHATTGPAAAVATTATATPTTARTANWSVGGNWRVRVSPDSIRTGLESLRRCKSEWSAATATGRRR